MTEDVQTDVDPYEVSGIANETATTSRRSRRILRGVLFLLLAAVVIGGVTVQAFPGVALSVAEVMPDGLFPQPNADIDRDVHECSCEGHVCTVDKTESSDVTKTTGTNPAE